MVVLSEVEVMVVLSEVFAFECHVNSLLILEYNGFYYKF